MSKVSDPEGLPYAGGGPTVKDDGTPLTKQAIGVVGEGTDTTSLTSTNTSHGGVASESSLATMGVDRSAGENSGTGFAST